MASILIVKKTLLGHADLRTTGIYLHLQQSKRDSIISP